MLEFPIVLRQSHQQHQYFYNTHTTEEIEFSLSKPDENGGKMTAKHIPANRNETTK